MNEVRKNEKSNIVYLLIGVLTLIIATTGATFAYYTATDYEASTMTGDMATITFNLTVQKVTAKDDELTYSNSGITRGLIPMSNSMVEYAVNPTSRTVNKNGGICEDDNGNAVCQIYKITVTNGGTASMFLDGYVTLAGGSGTPTLPTDYPNYTTVASPYVDNYYTTTKVDGKDVTIVDTTKVKNNTTMRWAQVFCSAESNNLVTACTTAGATTTTASKSDNGVASGITSNWSTILNTTSTTNQTETINSKTISHGESGLNRKQILTTGITTKAMIYGSEYNVINTNFIRLSNHDIATTYDQTRDITSALVYNEFLSSNDNDATNNTGTSSSTYTDAQVYYIVVWLSETGTNQTVNSTGTNSDGTTVPKTEVGFFTGTVKFVSAQGSEVTATFTDYVSVTPDTVG